jgi:hypothetical protein
MLLTREAVTPLNAVEVPVAGEAHDFVAVLYLHGLVGRKWRPVLALMS